MVNGTAVYLKSRELVGSKYIHQGRMKGIGIDCLGVVIWTANQLNLGITDVRNYPRNPDGTMQDKIAAVCPEIEMKPGALLVFAISEYPQHCGIVSNYNPPYSSFGEGLGLIHAWDIAGQVVEQRLTEKWRSRIVGCYGLPGVEYVDFF